MFGWRVNWKIGTCAVLAALFWFLVPMFSDFPILVCLSLGVFFFIPVANFYNAQQRRIASGEFPIRHGVPANSVPMDGPSLNIDTVTKSTVLVAAASALLAITVFVLVSIPTRSLSVKILVGLPVIVYVFSIFFCRAMLFEEGIAYRSPGHLFGMWFVAFEDIRSAELVDSHRYDLQWLALTLKSGDRLLINSVRSSGNYAIASDWLGIVESRITP